MIIVVMIIVVVGVTVTVSVACPGHVEADEPIIGILIVDGFWEVEGDT
jgi:hypothetical protein